MSLLMKALEKAAKDREDARGESPGVAGGTAQLALEPLHPAARQSATAPNATARDATTAATMIRAGEREPAGGIGVYLRDRPVFAFGALAALFLLCYGTYVYLQINNPGLFARQWIRPAQSAPSAPSITQPSTTARLVASAPPQTQLIPLLPPLQENADRASAQSTVVAAATAAAPAAPVLPATAPAPQAARDTIKVARGGEAPTLNPLLAQAYQALEGGDLEMAQRLYRELLQREPKNTDALLGLAAALAEQGDSEQANKLYFKVLEFDPRNAPAQAGLLGMLGRADPLAAETRLKQLIAREPSAFLYFTLGNLYADQNQWPSAQQAYFQAHHLQPDNPDYAYNLAVGLEHLAQPKLALEYYRRAAQLAAAKGRVNFSIAAARERIGKLEKIVE